MKAPTVKVRARKPWYFSRTLWVNAIALVLLTAEAKLDVLQGVLPGSVYQWAAFVLPLINALLRMRSLAKGGTP